MRLFPRWSEILGIEAEIRGRDLPIGAESGAYREVVGEIRSSAEVEGALVTTHKVDVYRHAGDLFDELDEYARICREVSCISKRDGALVGHAKDPITAGLALEHMLASDYWAGREAHVLCLGGGGAGTAITVYLLGLPEPPLRIVVTDRNRGRIELLEAVHAKLGKRTELAYRVVSRPAESDELVAELPPGSLVVNATGMGKDVPGSPLAGHVLFPENGIVWDLNYRGELEFLRQARAQAAERRLTLHDGWRYFLHGWSEVIVEVFHLELTPALFERLADAAAPVRPATPALLGSSARS